MQTSSAHPKPAVRGFYGWWIVAIAFVTFGIAVGLPYYNLPFFYDYFQSSFGWSIRQITFGFPLAALLTVWAGPLLIPKLSPRKLLVIGTGLTGIALFGFSRMSGALPLYFLFYFVYTVGYICAGPIPHQLLITYWFQRRRGLAMGIMYVGVGLVGGLGSFLVRFVTDNHGFRSALAVMAALMLLTWPLALFALRDRPSEVGQNPDGERELQRTAVFPTETLASLARDRAFWLLLIGSVCSIGSIGAINTHMKFVFRDSGFRDQHALNAAWTTASVLILWSSIVGRLSIGFLADVFSKRQVMISTYFIVAATTLLLFRVSPQSSLSLYVFALIFGFSMGADYMLIPLMAADQFGVSNLSRAMALILPLNTIGQTWFPFLIAAIREQFTNYFVPLCVVFAVSLAGAVAILLLPRRAQAK